MSSATSTPSPTMLIKITLCNTSDPTVSRLLGVPEETHFNEFHEAIAAAFGWESEPCTSWSFQNTMGSPLEASPSLGNDVFYYIISDQGYDVRPSRLDHDEKLKDWMGLDYGREYWLYDYNISRYHHAIEVMKMGVDDGPSEIRCLGGQGSIKRKAWQFGDFNRLKDVTAGKSSWEFDLVSTHKNMASVQAKYEMRKADEAAVRIGETIVQTDDDEDDDGMVRQDRGTKRRLSDSINEDYPTRFQKRRRRRS